MLTTIDIRYQVFLSSTYDDLREERQQATQAILEMGHMPAGMELFPASDASQWELIKRVIDESDYYVLIVGGRYGSIDSSTGLSYTEMEYDYAASLSIPILSFIRKDIGSIPARYTENTEEKKKKLELFRTKVQQKICRFYDAPADLGMHIMKSLMNESRTNPKTGWVRADKVRNEEDVVREKALESDLESANKKIKRLQRKIRDLIVPLEDVPKDRLARGPDKFPMTVMYQDQDKRPASRTVSISWDEIFSVIGPSMYGYIVRKYRASNTSPQVYEFEENLIQYIRSGIISECGNRQITLLAHEIDTIMIHLKQLGLLQMDESDKGDGTFRGYTLTPYGEQSLVKLKALEAKEAADWAE